MFDMIDPSSPPFDARIDTVLALLNQRREFARLGAEHHFSRAEIAELLKLSGDPWTSATLAELIHARRHAESVAQDTPYLRVVKSLLQMSHGQGISVRLMRRAISRPMEHSMLNAQRMLASLQADKMPMTTSACVRLNEELTALHRAWNLYGERLLSAYLQLQEREEVCAAARPAANSPAATAPACAPNGQAPGARNRRCTDSEPLLH